ncbi:GNAT family N-acetyltransferase [Catalinimonas niigatensis]|uniref:GNAT family N-acetyltransferase n=1 Tax=Catalinimonas niigatensis TaxID=1397264 RepID=UPI002664FECC|nr:GNAT family N-acetyltransferase [Catalinimonas niigatensis]WPP53248.1 GNAT family N-acetyltransferase [Catalinimonas niigatensis]
MKNPIVLHFEDFIIRPWQHGDEESLATYANNHKIWTNVRDRFPHPYTLKDAELWIRIADANNAMLNLAIETEGEAAGGVGIVFKQDIYYRTAEIGYWLGERFWNRGIATKAVKAMTDYIFDTPQYNICRMYAGIFEYNTASARVLEKAGYQLEARLRKSVTKNGNTVDELIYAKLKE